jgi:hypothetical protein
MAKNQDRIDLFWSRSGDFALGSDGDLADTSSNILWSFRQECMTRIQASLGDWALHPSIGADLDSIQGESNSPEIAERGKTLIIGALSYGGFCDSGDVSVRYVPVDRETIMYDITVSVAPTDENGEVNFVKLGLLHQLTESAVTFIG